MEELTIEERWEMDEIEIITVDDSDSDTNSKNYKALSDEQRLKIWNTLDKAAIKGENEFESVMQKFFTEQEKRVLENLVKQINSNVVKKDFDNFLNWTLEDGNLIAKMTPEWEKSFFEGSDTVKEIYNLEPSPKVLNERFTEWVESDGAELVKGINNTTKNELQKTISEGMQEGENIPKIKDRVQDVFKQAKESRATKIARTETHNSVSNGTFQTYESAGVKKKEWLTTVDGRERESHANINRQVRKIYQLFSNGLMYPGDANGAAEEVIHCRCTLLPVLDDE